MVAPFERRERSGDAASGVEGRREGEACLWTGLERLGGAALRMAALAAALAVACGEPRGELAVVAGPARIVSSAGGARGALERDGRRLLGLDRDAFVLGVSRAIDPERGYDPFWLVHPEPLVRAEPPEGLRWLRPVASSARLEGADIVIELGYGMDMRAEVRVTPVAAGRWRLRWTSRGPLPVAYHRLDLGIDPEEEMYGLGEWFDQPFHRGKRRSMQLEPDLRLEGASNEAHVPIPFILGTSGWGVLVRSERYGVFDVGADDPARLRITYGSAGEVNGLEAFVFAEASPLDLTRHYHEVTGRPALPAEWAYGPWIWRDESRDQAEVEADIRRIRDLDLPTSAIWIDRPYASAVNSFDFAPERYDDPEGMIRAARRAGLRVALWHTPYLEEKTGALRERALREGWFPPQVGFRANPWSEILDFTNPAARAWWQERLGSYTDLGIEGFKLDFAEDVLPAPGDGRFGWRFHDGSDGLVMHHRYPGLYHSTYAERLPEAGGFLLCRAARWGGQVHASVIWPGDLNASFAEHREPLDGGGLAVGGLPAAVSAAVGLGPSGFPLFGSDTGGYRGSPPDEETYIRWFQHTAFSAVMQVGDSSSQPPWVYTPENGRSDRTLDLYRAYARLHLRLFPYVWTFVTRNQTDGRAILRPLGLAHPELGIHPRHDYLLGDDILVAPVTARGARRRRVTLPEGRWLDGWTGETMEAPPGGLSFEADTPLERIPFFLRGGAVIPRLRPEVDTLAPAEAPGVDSAANEPGRLWVWVAGPPRRRETFEVFDGARVTSTPEAGGFRLELAPGARFVDGAVFEVLGAAPPSALEDLEGAPIPERADLDALRAADAGFVRAGDRTFVKPPGAGILWR